MPDKRLEVDGSIIHYYGTTMYIWCKRSSTKFLTPNT